MLDDDGVVPQNWQVELLRRFNRLLVQSKGHPTDTLNPIRP